MNSVLLAPFRAVGWVLAAVFDLVFNRTRTLILAGAGVVVAAALVGLCFTFTGLPVHGTQLGYRGTAMIVDYNPRFQRREIALNRLDTPFPAVTPAGRTAEAAYKNIQVLKDVDANEMLRLMAAMSTWLAPTIGCSYCHSAVNMADDKVYTKNIARHMLEMTRYINTNWKSHVGATGVTCNTCHRGHGIPGNVWFIAPSPGGNSRIAETDVGQNYPAPLAGETALPYDPFTPFFLDAAPIRVTGTTAAPNGNLASINQTDWTYALMVHYADALGVGCVFCHNSRAFNVWDQGTPNRVTAWYGTAMVRDLNHAFMVPITDIFPAGRRGPYNDVAKINCATCHQGAYKPFYGASNLDAYSELRGPAPTRTASVQGQLGSVVRVGYGQ
jgi:photosynthetic reaction center cytochrome c subunit